MVFGSPTTSTEAAEASPELSSPSPVQYGI